MKKTFAITIDFPDSVKNEGSEPNKQDIKYYIQEGIKGDFRDWCAKKFKVVVKEDKI